mgnify:CR=1 FL=1
MIMSQDKKFLVWSNNDPNDSEGHAFEVYAPNVDAAAWAALQDLGWRVSDTFIEDTPSDNDDATGNNT